MSEFVEVDGVMWCATHQGIAVEGSDRFTEDGDEYCDLADPYDFVLGGCPCDLRPLHAERKP